VNTAFDPAVPDMLPVLSRGKHRSARKGACFMELASFLAGERWSDHPSCTHPLLAALARYVNDLTSDAGRPALAPLIPSVIGVTGDDPHIDVRIALRCATTALPVVSEERQRVLALSVLACEHMLDVLDGRPDGTLEERSREVLARVPLAERWARGFERRIVGGCPVSVKAFRRLAAPNTVRCACEGLAQACVPATEDRLRELLASAIDDCAALVRAGSAPSRDVDVSRWAAACRLAGSARR
jgi:hypothetical protein